MVMLPAGKVYFFTLWVSVWLHLVGNNGGKRVLKENRYIHISLNKQNYQIDW
jgi:hypothetical protein